MIVQEQNNLKIFGSMYIKIRFDAPLELEERPEPFSFGKNHRSTTSYIHGFFSLYLIRRVKSSIVSGSGSGSG